MTGQSRPQEERRYRSRPRCGAGRAVVVCALMLYLLCGLGERVAGQEGTGSASGTSPGVSFGTIRLNISWNTATPEAWSGEITLDEGSFQNTTTLSNDATGSAAFQCNEQQSGKIRFKTITDTLFIGVQTTVSASLNSNLNIRLTNPRWEGQIVRTVALKTVLDKPFFLPFDDQENGLIIERAPGDELPVIFSKERVREGRTERVPCTMVFEPSEQVLLSVFPRLYSAGEQPLLLCAELYAAGNERSLWNQTIEIKDRTQRRYDFNMTIPEVDGAFAVHLTLTQKKQGFSLLPGQKETRQGTVYARRVVEGVVVGNQPAFAQSLKRNEEPFDLRNGLLETIDPTNPAWWKVFSRNSVFQSGNKTTTQEDRRPAGEKFRVLGQMSGAAGVDFLNTWKWGGLQLRLTPIKWGKGWGQWGDLWQGGLGSGDLVPYDQKSAQFSSFVRLNPGRDGEVTWESYTIPVREPGKPHLLEVEYLSGVPQSLGVSIIEPSVWGGIFPRSLDTGIEVSDDPLSDAMPGRVLSHRILFWPRTKTPMIVVTNRSREHAAVFGRLRLYRAKEEIAESPLASRGRTFSALMTKPYLADQFSAARVQSPVGAAGSENWGTFHQAITRMSEYLRIAGYDSLILGVAADGSALYPSSLLSPSPRFDSGVFLQQGEDPQRKDVVEFIARVFDAQGLALTPLVSFNTPVPRLEEYYQEQIRKDSTLESQLEGIRPIGPEGRLLIDSRRTSAGTGPYYNLLHPLVQEFMLAAVNELVSRYASHPCLKGVAIELSADTWAQLSDDIYYGMDDTTLARFIKETNLVQKLRARQDIPLEEFLTASGPGRYRVRAQFIKDWCRDDWIAWRCTTVHRFYQQMKNIVASRRGDLRVTLLGTDMLAGPVSQTILYPNMTKSANVREAFLGIGMNPDLYTNDDGLVLVRPGRLSASESLCDNIDAFELASARCAALFTREESCESAGFFHKTDPKNLPKFDAECPFQPAVTQIATIALPNDYDNRRRFINQLALADTASFIDGGEMLPMGQEDSLFDFISVFRAIPALNFTAWSPGGDAEASAEKDSGKVGVSLQPVLIRTARTADETWVCIINNAPFHTGLTLRVDYRKGTKFEVIRSGVSSDSPLERPENLTWTLSLRPYDLVALRLTDPQATLGKAEVKRPEEICGPNGTLATEVRNYINRALVARSGLTCPLRNSDFEESIAAVVPEVTTDEPQEKAKSRRTLELPGMTLLKNPFQGAPLAPVPVSGSAESNGQSLAGAFTPGDTIPGWRRFGDPLFQAIIDTEVRKNGQRSLKLSAHSAGGGIISQPIEVPATGRLCLSLALGLQKDATSCPLRVCLTGRLRGEPWQRQVLLGPTVAQRLQAAREAGTTFENDLFWTSDVILFDRLPLSGLEELSLRFDMPENGTLWLDDLRLYKLALADSEQKELMRLINTAEYRISKDKVCDSMALLAGYWPQLLKKEIPADSPLLTANAAKVANRQEAGTESTPDPATSEPKKEAKSLMDRLLFR
ncbi:MAG: hypothetical protein Q4G68_05470 [Planctomycetia bacterium]|nr:hypothetical protein [Planctomycetia bacterium]